jgi:hypothetical protein
MTLRRRVGPLRGLYRRPPGTSRKSRPAARRQGKHDEPAREGQGTHANNLAVQDIRDGQRRCKQATQYRHESKRRLLRRRHWNGIRDHSVVLGVERGPE